MEAEGDANPEVQEVGVTEIAVSSMSIEDALQQVLKKALIHDGLARGIRECVKALDRYLKRELMKLTFSRAAHLCVLAESCDQAAYAKLIEALCAEHDINLVKVADAKKLGEWAGLCKIDREGNPRKVVGCGCVVVKDFGEQSEAMDRLLDVMAVREE